jgi:hypothetical protein
MSLCTETRPNRDARTHTNVVDYTRITVKGGTVKHEAILKCLNCGREIDT